MKKILSAENLIPNRDLQKTEFVRDILTGNIWQYIILTIIVIDIMEYIPYNLKGAKCQQYLIFTELLKNKQELETMWETEEYKKLPPLD